MFDLANFYVRELDPSQGTKPLDFGGGGITGSINLDGRFIAINTAHPEHGYVSLTSAPPFPDADRYDQAKVRTYRQSLVTNKGFGIRFEQDIIQRQYYLIEDAIPLLRFGLADGTTAECITLGHGVQVMQIWKLSRSGVPVSTTGKIWLQRAAYTQLTEGGVVPMPSSKTTVRNAPDGQDNTTQLTNHAIKAAALINLLGLAAADDGICLGNEFVLEQTFVIACAIGDELITDEQWLTQQMQHVQAQRLRHEHLIISRALHYGRICTVSDCIMTDHMILPLSWNRDAYYITLAMQVQPETESYNKAHLHWLFADAQTGTYCKMLQQPNPDAWARAYMVNGTPKDNNAFQLDQQIFPLLELCMIWDSLSQDDRQTEWVESGIQRALQAIQASMASDHQGAIASFVTDETPADDELRFPYHFSSHILLWHTLRLLETNPVLAKFVPVNLNSNDLFHQIQSLFITKHEGEAIYSYATDGEKHYLYQDANDMPLVLMPLWGFCKPDDVTWRSTVDFAFSDANPGFFDGVLGSVHSPAPWALGDAQELILCKMIGDRKRYQTVWERIVKVAQWDGALPEAYDAHTYEVVSRHWFAWPNAMVAIAHRIPWEWEAKKGTIT